MELITPDPRFLPSVPTYGFRSSSVNETLRDNTEIISKLSHLNQKTWPLVTDDLCFDMTPHSPHDHRRLGHLSESEGQTCSKRDHTQFAFQGIRAYLLGVSSFGIHQY